MSNPSQLDRPDNAPYATTFGFGGNSNLLLTILDRPGDQRYYFIGRDKSMYVVRSEDGEFEPENLRKLADLIEKFNENQATL